MGKNTKFLSATIENKVARFNYNIAETYIAGICLTGPEVCSLREGKAKIVDGWCYVTDDNEIFIKNMYIASHSNANNSFVKFDETRDRKLLLTKKEIIKIKKELDHTGITCIPLKAFRSDNGLYKILIGIARGKRDYDKRNAIKERDSQREINRTIKNY